MFVSPQPYRDLIAILLIAFVLIYKYVRHSKQKNRKDHESIIKNLLITKIIKYPVVSESRFINVGNQKKKIINRTKSIIQEIIETTDCEYGDFWIAWWALRDIVDIGYVWADLDIYSTNLVVLSNLNEYFVKKTNNWYLLENDKTFKLVNFNGMIIDLVKLHYKSPTETIANFDMTVCTIACDWVDVYYHPDFFNDLSVRKICFHKILYPEYSLNRVERYIGKWFSISDNEMTILKSMIDEDVVEKINKEYTVKYSIIKDWVII